eukprot:scaffold64529_cov74-Phaeocystis_antarctica.AAC.8
MSAKGKRRGGGASFPSSVLPPDRPVRHSRGSSQPPPQTRPRLTGEEKSQPPYRLRSRLRLLPPPAPLPPAPPESARRTAPPLRRWRSSPGARPCHRATPAPGRAWTCRDWRGPRQRSPSCCRPRVASTPQPAPAAAPACSSTAAALLLFGRTTPHYDHCRTRRYCPRW